MMKSNIVKILLACLICTVAFGTSCILEDKVVQLVFTSTTSADFPENSEDENWTTIAVIDYADQIDDILADNDLARDSVESAILVSAYYGVTKFNQNEDWEISGAILVDRRDISIAQDTIVSYDKVKVRDALGRRIPADLHAGGVNIMDQALAQYIAGTHDPILEFTVANGNVDPDPTPANPIIFDWRAWLKIQVILSETFEVPDPF
jgi:hypothetical protein